MLKGYSSSSSGARLPTTNHSQLSIGSLAPSMLGSMSAPNLYSIPECILTSQSHNIPYSPEYLRFNAFFDNNLMPNLSPISENKTLTNTLTETEQLANASTIFSVIGTKKKVSILAKLFRCCV